MINRTVIAGMIAAVSSAAIAAQTPRDINFLVSDGNPNSKPASFMESEVSFPGRTTFALHPSDGMKWIDAGEFQFDLFWPENGPTNVQVMAHMKDWDHFWYQKLMDRHLAPGANTRFRVDLSPASSGWEPQGHKGSWHLRALMDPKEFRVRIFSDTPFNGTCRIGNVTARPRPAPGPPWIRNVRRNADRVPCYGKFEVSFSIPDSYPDPFDPDKVRVSAVFRPPGGNPITVDGFYARDFYRQTAGSVERAIPQGPPFWRVRFAPTVEGTYEYTLSVLDARYPDRPATWGPATFIATEPAKPGFARVSGKDPRFFEFGNGAPFFPIGHNIRSPYDLRMHNQFPWQWRPRRGPSSYDSYFNAMAEHGENFVEVWSAAWSLGLEWTEDWHGYHGIGQFNMMNAWDMDRVMALADELGIYVNIVVHNHGKFSTFCDQEWEYNPFNTKNGGYLEKPEDYFTDRRALSAFRKLMRYMVARWGYNTAVFGWELWSELDLVGSKHQFHKSKEAVEWHRLMGSWIKSIDPYDHMISTHVCGDYTHQNPDIISLPEMDFCAIDAYHYSHDPIYIVELITKSANYNAGFKKPVLITEFGGSHMAKNLKHLEHEIHAALWASTCACMGGTPLFWWWEVIDEEHYYREYSAVKAFMQDEDRRNPSMTTLGPGSGILRSGQSAITVNLKSKTAGLTGLCYLGPEGGLGWIYQPGAFNEMKHHNPITDDLSVTVGGLSNGVFRAEFWDTSAGQPVSATVMPAHDGSITLDAPPFGRDIAFKLKLSRNTP